MAVLGVTVLTQPNKTPSRQSLLTIQASKNKFSLDFSLIPKDQEKASYIFEKLNLDPKTANNIEFELDSTSSAKLAFALPIAANFSFEENRVNLNGQISGLAPKETLQPKTQVKLPTAASLVLAGSNLRNLIDQKYELSIQLKDWLNSNTENGGREYLAIFTKNPQFIFVSNKSQAEDLSSLGAIFEGQDEKYKQETQEDINFHLIKVGQDQLETLSIFQYENLLIISSSLESAKKFIAIQKGQEEHANFTKIMTNGLSYALVFQNDQAEESTKALAFISSDVTKIQKFVEKIKSLELYIQGKDFNGSVTFL